MRSKSKALHVRFAFLISIFLTFYGTAQRETKASRTELGVFGGVGYYLGDLNPTGHFKYIDPGVGLLYRFNVHSRLALRATATATGYQASDADSQFDLHRNRNLSVYSDLYELAGGLEFNYWPYKIGHWRYKATAYFLVEMAAFYFDPMTQFNGQEYALRTLGTEGQGTTLNNKDRYSRIGLSIPVGLGFRCSLGKRFCLNIEYAIRKTFTDYMDDVKADYYVNNADLAEQSGATAAALSNRSIDPSRNGRRGNSSTKDWYAFTSVMISFKIKNPNKCFFEPY